MLHHFAFWNFLTLGNSAWDFIGVNFWPVICLGFAGRLRVFWVLIFALVLSSPSLDIRSPHPHPYVRKTLIISYWLLPFAARRFTKMARNLYVEFWDPADLSSHRSPLLVKEYALPKQFTKIKKKGLKLTYILTPARASTDLLIKARRAKWQKAVMIPFSTILKEYKGRRITDPLPIQTL